LYATAGVHPHHATELDDDAAAALRTLLQRPEVVAAGECGLDYFRNYSPRPAQLAAFSRQLQLAAEAGKPLFLHQRDAHQDFIAVLREHRTTLRAAVAHCLPATASSSSSIWSWGWRSALPADLR
jgi:TatD DNase family protein